MIVNLPRRADLLYLALAHDNDLVGNTHGLGLVVGDINRRDSHLLLDLADFRPHGHPQLGV